MFLPNIHVLEEREHGDHGSYACLVISPLITQQATILATNLRQLLCTLEGPCITVVKFDGFEHELDTVPGIHESAGELLEHLSKITVTDTRLCSEAWDQWQSSGTAHQLIYAAWQGPKVIRAGDLPVRPPLKVVNPHQYLARLSPGTQLGVSCLIQNPSKVVSASGSWKPPGSLMVQGTRYAVTKVNTHFFDLDMESRQGMFLEIWTDGKLTARQAVILAGLHATRFFRALPALDCPAEDSNKVSSEARQKEQ